MSHNYLNKSRTQELINTIRGHLSNIATVLSNLASGDARDNTKAPINHNQPSSTITAMTGYTKPQTTSAITASDTLNEAIGKLEKAVDGAGTPNDGVLTIQQNGTTLGTFSANQSGNTTINIQAPAPSIYNDAVNASNGSPTIVENSTNVGIIDNVSYYNLSMPYIYTLKTEVYDLTTGNLLNITKDGVSSTEITSAIELTDDNGVYDNSFSIDSVAGISIGSSICVDETLYLGSDIVARSLDILTIVETPKVYGFRIDKNNTNPYTRVTYLYDAVGMTPAYMNFSQGTFNYGSWANVWFVSENRPVALNFDGTVDYELDHTDFTKKLDGTASDVSDASYAGNFMSEMPTVYVKRWEDSNYNYMAFSKVKVDNDYLAQAHTNANGVINSHIYLPMFKGSVSDTKLRSLMGTYPKNFTSGSAEITYASNCGSGWQLWDKAKIDLIMDLIILITKSTNCRATIGNGDCNTYNSSDTTTYGMMKSGYETDGSTRSTNAQFYGFEGTETTNYGLHHMIAFYIEDLWGNRTDRCLGFHVVNNKYIVKMTPPYALTPDSTYTTLDVVIPSGSSSSYVSGYIKNISSGTYGGVPTAIGASSTTGFASDLYANKGSYSLGYIARFGGSAGSSVHCGRAWTFDSEYTQGQWFFGGSPCYSAS